LLLYFSRRHVCRCPTISFSAVSKPGPTGASQHLFLLSVGWINQERSVDSVVQIYDKEEPDGLIYETDEAEKEAENHYWGVIAICSTRKEVHKRAATLPGKNSFNVIIIGKDCKHHKS